LGRGRGGWLGEPPAKTGFPRSPSFRRTCGNQTTKSAFTDAQSLSARGWRRAGTQKAGRWGLPPAISCFCVPTLQLYSRLRCTSRSRTSPPSSAARQSQNCRPAVVTAISSRCHREGGRGRRRRRTRTSIPIVAPFRKRYPDNAPQADLRRRDS